MTDVLRTIGDISRALDAISNVEFKSAGLTKGQYVYLARIVEHPGIIQSRLAEMIRVDRTTVAHAVKKLEQDGLIVRRTDEANKKNKTLYPTDVGRAAYPRISAENQYSEAMALATLDATQQQTLQTLLDQVRTNVTKDWQHVMSGHPRQY